jgi:ABC-type branched-subunit amino acid transport system ATPase component
MADLAGADALVLEGVSVRFGGVAALQEVSLSVGAGTAVGVIGPNGAGKTTLLNAASGFVQPKAGRVLVGGADLTTRSAANRALRGLGRTFQTPRLFPGMTVHDNLAVVAHRRRGEGLSPAEALEITGARHLADAPVERLVAGERRFVELARSLMLGPVVLLLDEPATGLRDAEVDTLVSSLRRLGDEHGLALLVISHDMRVIDECCEAVVVLDRGSVLARGTPDEIRREPRVVEAYFGTEAAD